MSQLLPIFVSRLQGLLSIQDIEGWCGEATVVFWVGMEVLERARVEKKRERKAIAS